MTDAQRPSIPPNSVPRTPPPPGRPPASAPPMGDLGQTGQQMPSQTFASTQANTAPGTRVSPAPGGAKPSMGAPAVKPPPTPAPPPMMGHRPAAPPPMQASRSKASPGQPTLAQIVREAYDKGFSDIHLGVGEAPRFRNRGEIDMTEYPVTDLDTFFSWLQEILSDAEIQRFKDTLDFDGATQYDFARVRINIFDSLRGPAMVMRLIPLKILTIEQLGLPPVFKEICHYHKGLILVTGPTGSGKSTTMAAMVDYMNSEMPKHIVTIEDPIEFVHTSRKCLIRQREVGIHTMKFDAALKASLREDPDVILVGEMRDIETVNTALKAAQTGHLVMGTLHTNSAVKTIERILGLYPPDQQEPMRVAIAESLVAVIAQGLCRTTDGKRAAFHDILINTDAIRDYIRKGDLDEVEALIPRCNFDGMCTMNQSLYKLYEAGRITEETALEMSPKPNEMAQILRGRV
ncbi:type IV pilus twitching motility protein PilT [Thermoleptolyngbya sp. C42_A2020_037]|uniref:type IV pilus twitching motility protein PilT n=1 Tax=Thermoleptolyngbya sp. C42_A2020_037 TaxID=2747799 RepID=UPI001A07F480|nr:type IV pilus twitching motility protein PilT [Thermoleptolyngbya sp. C42_A2020_037]MBF2086763.1 type IV pilus twitching motility protein PilT [Thermoleptolyngbya sp. C42_A2020_037]